MKRGRERWADVVDSSDGEDAKDTPTLLLLSEESYDKPALEMAETGPGGGTLQMEHMLSLQPPDFPATASATLSDRVTVPVEMPRALAKHFLRGGSISLESAPGPAAACDSTVEQQSCGSSASATPATKRQRPNHDPTSKEPLRKVSRDDEVEVIAETGDAEGDWERRTKKRAICVERIKAQTELNYSAVLESRRRHRVASLPPTTEPSPRTPDPMDRSISKRRWEDAIVAWKDSLRLFSEQQALQQPPAQDRQLWSDMFDSSEEECPEHRA